MKTDPTRGQPAARPAPSGSRATRKSLRRAARKITRRAAG